MTHVEAGDEAGEAGTVRLLFKVWGLKSMCTCWKHCLTLVMHATTCVRCFAVGSRQAPGNTAGALDVDIFGRDGQAGLARLAIYEI